MTIIDESRRLGDRAAVNKAGQILDDADCVTKVIVRDMSPTGARLEAGFGAIIPQTFRLRIRGETMARPAEVVWRAGQEVGIRFSTGCGVAPVKISAAMVTPSRGLSVLALRALAAKARKG